LTERGADIGIENIQGHNAMWGANKGLKRYVGCLEDKKMAFERNETAATDENDDIRMDFEDSSAYMVQNLGCVTPSG
jgi:hypothetical protein